MKIERIFLLLFVLMGLFSCTASRYIYAPAPANNPFFKEKGESKLTASYSEGDGNQNGYARGWDLQGAYALSNHWAVTASYFNRREMDRNSISNSNVSEIKYKRNLLGFGSGYFIALNSKKTITFNLYAGLDFGKFSFDDKDISNPNSSDSRFHSSNITKGYFQPSFNFMPGKYIRFSFFMKSSYVGYGDIKTSYTSDELKYYSLDELGGKTWNFLEFGWDFQFGIPKYPWIRLEWQVSSINWTVDPYYLNYQRPDVRRSNFSIGLTIDFSKMKDKID
ncbi:MAG: hypothetical protein ABI208_06230 [Ginsengibacter sp.]